MTTRLPLALLTALLLPTPDARGQEPSPAPTPAPTAAAGSVTPHAAALHEPFDALLREHVRDGRVHYAGLLAQRAALRAYLATLADVDASRFTREQTLALWINAYNAATLELMLDHFGKLDSIRDIPSSQRWEAERWRVAGRRVSLDAIEHEILRPLGEPRIHFAIVCASRSCPDLRSEAYVPTRLDEQLDDATRHFLADPAKGLATATTRGFFGGENHELRLSRIFDWFEEDFERGGGDVVSFVLPYAPTVAAGFIRSHRDDLDVEHLDYDWSINDDPARRQASDKAPSHPH